MLQIIPASAETLKKDKKGSIVKAILYSPVAVTKFVAVDTPTGIALWFNPKARKIKKCRTDLNSTDWHKRYSAVHNLSTVKHENAYVLLIEALTDNNVMVSLKAYESLKKAKKKNIVPFLVESLESYDPWTRKLVIDLLGYFSDPQSIKPIVFLANDEYRQVRLSAILALEDISDESLLFQFFPMGDANESRENIINWWYQRGKIIEEYLSDKKKLSLTSKSQSKV